jgi:hypothetical protein
MSHLSVDPLSDLRPFYPHTSDSYNDQATSDITLCFGDNEKVYAHEVVLKAASGVWNQAFKSKLPIATQATYDIQGHPDLVIYAMLRHVYETPLEAKPSEISEEGRLDYLFDVFAIANEYQLPSLGEAVTERVVQLMKTYRIEPGRTQTAATYARDAAQVREGKKKLGAVFSRTAELYINNNVLDQSLMHGVQRTCYELRHSLKWMEEHLHIFSLIGKHDPFSALLFRTYLPSMH